MTDAITLAVITSPHGLDGSVKLKLFTDDVERLKRYKSFDTNRGVLTLVSLRTNANATIARFIELPDRTTAEQWRAIPLTVPSQSLPEPAGDDEFYYSELVGLAVMTPNGKAVGHVSAVENYGAGDLLEIMLATGKTVLVPFRDVAVPHVDMKARVVTVEPDFLR